MVVSLIVSLRKIDKFIRTIRNQATICRIVSWSSGVTVACLVPRKPVGEAEIVGAGMADGNLQRLTLQ
jgi:hypothetical protein